VASQLTRKELKQDKFAVEVEHTVDYFAAHRKQTLRYGVTALIAILIAGGAWYFRNSQASVRQQVLGEALTLTTAPVGVPQPGAQQTFPTDAAKNDAVTKAFNKIVSDYGGTQEGYVAEYYLAANALGSGRPDEARKKYQDVADHADANFSSLAKLSLAQLDAGDNKLSDAEKIFKDLIDHPTALVSKAQATIAYAKAIGSTRPDEARKLLMPLTTDKDQAEVAPIANQALAQLPQK
jgi:predicted negative regulator of RcsB-dependent stress response